MDARRLQLWQRFWEIVPIAGVTVLRIFREIVFGGFKHWRWWEDILLVIGWVVGWILLELDDLFYAYVSNPHEVTSQRVRQLVAAKDVRGVWNLLQATKGERTRTPIRNALAMMVIGISGVWIVTTTGNTLGSGVVLGLGIRLLSEYLAEEDREKWWWIFSREFASQERLWIMGGFAGALLWQGLMIIRG